MPPGEKNSCSEGKARVWLSVEFIGVASEAECSLHHSVYSEIMAKPEATTTRETISSVCGGAPNRTHHALCPAHRFRRHADPLGSGFRRGIDCGSAAGRRAPGARGDSTRRA